MFSRKESQTACYVEKSENALFSKKGKGQNFMFSRKKSRPYVFERKSKR